MLRYSAPSAADADVAWSLFAQPARWHEWSPHVRGAWGLRGDEIVRPTWIVTRVFGVVPLPTRISLVERSEERRHWVWRVGPARFDHGVRRDPDGCTVTMTCTAPRPIERCIKVAYWPLVRRTVDRLATRAEESLPRPAVAEPADR